MLITADEDGNLVIELSPGQTVAVKSPDGCAIKAEADPQGHVEVIHCVEIG
jgi:hypothetical protein